MGMLKNLFGSGKKYYLELDEAQEEVVKAVSKAADVVKEQATELTKSQPVKQAVEAASQVGQTAQETVSETVSKVVSDKKPADKKPAKAKVKAKAKAKTEAKSQQNGKVAQSDAKPQQAKPSLKNSGASSFDPPFWVAAMYKNSSATSNGSTPTDSQTFATDNLMPTMTKYRRRPGGSLNKFKDMAKKAKTPRG